MDKLTDDELSMVLSQQADGKLDHSCFYRESDGRGCVAGAALALGKDGGEDLLRAYEISNAIDEGALTSSFKYPRTPAALLQLLADKGLA